MRLTAAWYATTASHLEHLLQLRSPLRPKQDKYLADSAIRACQASVLPFVSSGLGRLSSTLLKCALATDNLRIRSHYVRIGTLSADWGPHTNAMECLNASRVDVCMAGTLRDRKLVV